MPKKHKRMGKPEPSIFSTGREAAEAWTEMYGNVRDSILPAPRIREQPGGGFMVMVEYNDGAIRKPYPGRPDRGGGFL